MMRSIFSFAVALALAAPAGAADETLTTQVANQLRAAAGPGTRFGLVVTDLDGREIVAIAPDDRFVPASNTKMFTTAAAFASLDVASPDADGGAAVRLEGGPRAPAVVLEGHGDARLSSATGCAIDCLATLADAVAAKTRVVGDVIGDDSAFPDERWGPGMSWNNIPTRSGTAASALSLDDNEIVVLVTPGTAGRAATIDAPGYFTYDNRVTSGVKTVVSFDRAPNRREVRIDGTVAAPETLRLGIDDPADYAAWRLREMLVARGVRVMGRVAVRHRPLSAGDDPRTRGGALAAKPPMRAPLARLLPAPLGEDLVVTNKVSQNLHAELLLRRVGAVRGTGSIADGRAAVAAMLTEASVPAWAYDFADGSGMSSYNRVAPRHVATFLRWTQAQPWGAAWRATLPVGGLDGTLRRRFAGTALAGKLFAKTGTLDKASALSGFMVAASGRTLVVASFAADMPEGAAATKAVDAALLQIAAAN